jgi:hypothetical protein
VVGGFGACTIPMTTAANDAAMPRLAGVAGLFLCIAAIWMIQHPYEGVVHDAVLYSLSALARLHPESLGHDVFLSVGEQDRFTLFGPIAAALTRLLGLERAASVLTLIAQAAFFGCAWLLARRVLPSTLAILSVALLVMLPSTYGAKHVFSYAELFMTPRLPAEALVLAGLAAALGGRHVLASVSLLAAGLLHPLMAAAGVMLLFVLYVGLPRPRLALSLAVGGFVALAVVAWVAPFGPVARFSDGWFNLMYSRGTYLFPTQWPTEDYEHACVPLAALLITAIMADKGLIRSICASAIIVGIAGLVITIVGADALRIVLVAQLQPWRWLWLTNLLAVILTPLALQACWRKGNPGRAVAVLLVASWVLIDENLAPVVALLTIAAAATAHRVTDPLRGRLFLGAACVVLLMSVAVLFGFVEGVLKAMSAVAPDPVVYDSPYLLVLRRWRPWLSGGIAPACLFFAAWWAVTRRPDRRTALTMLTCGAALCVAAAPLAWKAWTRISIPDRIYARFAPWRQVIPPDAQVLWMQSPLPVWYLLERSSYWTHDQMAASVYSEAMARELARREWILTSQEVKDPHQDLIGICHNNPQLGFFVTTIDMGPNSIPTVIIDSYMGAGQVHLYRCADSRG